MEYTGWLSLMATGAVLRWVVRDVLPGVDVTVIGLVLLVAGAAGVVVSLATWTLRRHDALVAREPRGPGAYER